MKVIDAHHHLWNRDLLSYPWLDDTNGKAIFGSYDALRRNYLVQDYLSDCAGNNVSKSVHVQAEHDEEDPVAETRWIQSVADAAESGGFPHGIVAFANLANKNVEAVIAAHTEFSNLRGIRQILNYHPNPRLTYTPRNFLDDATWMSNFSLLAKYGLSFDLQLYSAQMLQAAALANEHDGTLFVLNHAGMPVERDPNGLAQWRSGMSKLAECPNVCSKISGLGMCEPNWTEASIRPFVLETIDLFGTDRCMFASNFPVDSIFSDFSTLYGAFKSITAGFSSNERTALFYENARRVYRL